MDILTLKSKDYLGCDNCDKCCINRGDIKLTPINVILISKYLNISLEDFLMEYTHEIENEQPEIVINAVGERKDCIFYDRNSKNCSIHEVEPMQCAMYPLVPENITRDYFYNKGTCVCKVKKLIKVDTWINGTNNIYKKYKDVYLEWIDVIYDLQEKWENLTKETKEKIKNILYLNYDLKKKNIKKQVQNNIETVRRIIKKTINCRTDDHVRPASKKY